MVKIPLSTLLSGYLTTDLLNQNFDDIETEFQTKVLYRDNPTGEPNQMENNLDMNSNRILNLPSPTSDSEPARWVDVRDGVTGVEEVVPSKTGNSFKMLGTDGSGLVFYETGLVVDNISDMKDLSKTLLRDNFLVTVLGYSSVGDGGEGKFYWDSSSGATDVDGLIESNSAGGVGRFKRLYKGPVNVLWCGADPTGSSDSYDAFNAALGTGHSVYAPEGLYLISDTLSLTTGGQSLFGDGLGPSAAATTDDSGTILRWTGSSGNFIEFASGRNGAQTSDTVTGLQLYNIKLETASGSTLDRLIWIEDGVFHSIIEKLHVRGLSGVPSSDIIKFESNSGYSYPVGTTLRDITLRGSADGNGDPTPLGIWIESAIETYLDRIMVYDCEKGYVLGADNASNFRIVTNLYANRCQADLLKGRAGVTTDGVALQIYQAGNTNWIGGKFLTGSTDANAVDIRGVLFSGVGTEESRNISFLGTQFDGLSRANYAIEFGSNATNFRDVNFDYCDFTGLVTDVMTVASGSYPIIGWGKNNTYNGVVPEPYFNYRAKEESANPSSLADGDGETIALLSDFSVSNRRPLLFSCGTNLSELILTGYKSGGATVAIRLQNKTGGTIDLANSSFFVRPLDDHEIAASSTTVFDPVNTADGQGETTTVTVPGAKVGDFSFIVFDGQNVGNLNGMLLTSYVSADDTVSVRFQNETGALSNRPESVMRAGIIKPIFDYAGSKTYDPPSLADGDFTSTTVTALGAEVGDFAVASFSEDLSGLICTAYVSSGDTVTVLLYNGTGGAVDIASSTLKVGVFKNGE